LSQWTWRSQFQAIREVQFKVNQLSSEFGQSLPDPPMLLTYKQFIEDIKPNMAMWSGFSLFAFVCAAMVDFFTVLLSYQIRRKLYCAFINFSQKPATQ
jgi:hypothetical protein